MKNDAPICDPSIQFSMKPLIKHSHFFRVECAVEPRQAFPPRGRITTRSNEMDASVYPFLKVPGSIVCGIYGGSSTVRTRIDSGSNLILNCGANEALAFPARSRAFSTRAIERRWGRERRLLPR